MLIHAVEIELFELHVSTKCKASFLAPLRTQSMLIHAVEIELFELHVSTKCMASFLLVEERS